jgi:hypothetical protein
MYLIVGALGVIGALMIGIAEFIDADFDASFLKEASFWVNIITTNVGICCLIISIVLIRVDSFKRNNEQYLLSEQNINTFYRTKYVAPVFRKFCYSDNLKTKITVYKHNINRKYSKVKATPNDLEIFYNGTEEQKKANKYCQKMAYFDKMLSEEYVDRVLPRLSMKYPRISDSLIFTGYHNEKQVVDFITTNKFQKMALDLLPKFLLSFSAISFLAGFSADLKEGITYAAVFKLLCKLFTILMQIYSAYTYADRYNIEVTLHDIRFRESKLNDYEVWENRQLNSIKEKEVTSNGN